MVEQLTLGSGYVKFNGNIVFDEETYQRIEQVLMSSTQIEEEDQGLLIGYDLEKDTIAALMGYVDDEAERYFGEGAWFFPVAKRVKPTGNSIPIGEVFSDFLDDLCANDQPIPFDLEMPLPNVLVLRMQN